MYFVASRRLDFISLQYRGTRGGDEKGGCWNITCFSASSPFTIFYASPHFLHLPPPPSRTRAGDKGVRWSSTFDVAKRSAFLKWELNIGRNI